MNKFVARQIATSREGNRIAISEVERLVSIWDIKSGNKVSEFDTILDFGGRRLAIDKSGEYCVTGAYASYGIACYAISDGSQLWQRKDLKTVQRIRISLDGTKVNCFFEKGAGHALDLKTGETLSKLSHIRDIIESPFENACFLEKHRPQLKTPNGKYITIVDKSHPMNWVYSSAFTPGLLIVAHDEVISLFQTKDGKRLDTCIVDFESSPSTMAYSEKNRLLYMLLWNRGKKVVKLVFLDPQTLHYGTVSTLGMPAEVKFCSYGNQLVTSEGILLDVKTGKEIKRLSSPKESAESDRIAKEDQKMLAEVKKHLEKGGKVNGIIRGKGVSWLQLAAMKGYVRVAKFLIANGADVKRKNEYNGSTLLHQAVLGSYEMVELVLEQGLDVNAKLTTNQATPLHQAATYDKTDIAELLILRGADVNAKTKRGETPLHTAFKFSSSELIKLLLSEDAEINVVDNDGKAPLHLAVESKKKEVVELLIAKGANINAKNQFGETPLHIAVRNLDKKMVEVLLTNNANSSLMDEEGRTPLHLAMELEGGELANILRRYKGK